MKRNTQSIDKSAPYRTHSLNKITAPVKHGDEPRVTKTVGKNDLRGGKKA